MSYNLSTFRFLKFNHICPENSLIDVRTFFSDYKKYFDKIELFRRLLRKTSMPWLFYYWNKYVTLRCHISIQESNFKNHFGRLIEILRLPQYQFMRMIPFGRSLRSSENFNLNFRFFIVQILPLLIAQIKDGWLPNFTTNLGLCFQLIFLKICLWAHVSISDIIMFSILITLPYCLIGSTEAFRPAGEL